MQFEIKVIDFTIWSPLTLERVPSTDDTAEAAGDRDRPDPTTQLWVTEPLSDTNDADSAV